MSRMLAALICRIGRSAQDLRPDQPVAVVVRLLAANLGQLGEADALAQR
jgi:hypothetical protein